MQVKKQQLELDWFQIGKAVRQGCILSLCLFNLHAEYIMQNAGLGIKIAGRNINNFRYADDTTLMSEREELKSLFREGNGNPLQYSCLENPMDGGAW